MIGNNKKGMSFWDCIGISIIANIYIIICLMSEEIFGRGAVKMSMDPDHYWLQISALSGFSIAMCLLGLFLSTK